MKLKAVLLVAFAAAGVGASIAVADTGKGNDQGQEHGHGCRALHVSGTIAPQTFVITLTHGVKTGPSTSSTVTVTIGGAGQTVRATVEGCTSAPGGTAKAPTSASARSVVLMAVRTPTTGEHTGGDDHRGTTTTTTGATAAHP
jgi:hypothetical protein